jgi:hypothetical protein
VLSITENSDVFKFCYLTMLQHYIAAIIIIWPHFLLNSVSENYRNLFKFCYTIVL